MALACGLPRVDVIHHSALRSPDFPRGVKRRATVCPTRPGDNSTLGRMLILLPPSESKIAPQSGPQLDIAALSFPELRDDRREMVRRLVEVSARDDAAELLKTGPSLSEEVKRNIRLEEAPTAPAMGIYNGVLYDALGYHTLDRDARSRADGSLLVMSALWGAVTPGDLIPAYRLSMGAKVVDGQPLASWWKPRLKPVLDRAAEGRIIVDCRSSGYAAAWKSPSDRTVSIRVVRERHGQRSVVSHMAKHYRGQAARILLESECAAQSIDDVAENLAPHMEVELSTQGRQGSQITLILRE